MAYVLRVGELYNPARTRWPERPILRLTGNGAELLLLFREPTQAEATAVADGTAEFAWIPGDRVAVLAYRFGNGVAWSDVPYHPDREPPGSPPLIVPPGAAMLLTVVLLDALTGIVRALRVVSWPVKFTAAVIGTVTALRAQQFDAARSDTELNDLYDRYTTKELVLLRARAVCTVTGPRTRRTQNPL